METLRAVLARGRERDGTVLDAPGRTTPYSYREFCTNAWKAGNLLRHYGVRPGGTVALVVGPKAPDGDRPGWLGTAADPLLGLFGGGAVGATVDLTPAVPVDARALVAPDAWLDRYEVRPGCSRLAYGGPPEAADVAHFERELWSENPVEPPDEVRPETTLLRVDGTDYTHGDLLEAATAVAAKRGLTAGDSVGLAAPVTTPGAFVAGVLAPVTAGATVRPGIDTEPAATESLAYVVRADPDHAGSDVLDPASVPL
jgi:hypothetical protein